MTWVLPGIWVADVMFAEIIEEKTVPKMLVAYASYHVDMISADFAEVVVTQFYQALKVAGVSKSDCGGFFAAYDVTGFRKCDYDLELWERVRAVGKETEIIKYKMVPRAKVACMTVGDCLYADPQQYQKLFDYVAERNYTFDGWPRETYIMNPASSTGYIIKLQIPFFF